MVTLTVLFFVLGNPEPVELEGWGQRSYPSLSSCLNASFALHDYLEEVGLPEGTIGVIANCR